MAGGLNLDGRSEVFGIASGPSEAETFWTDFLRSLADRGMRGVKLVIADHHKGLRAVAQRVAVVPAKITLRRPKIESHDEAFAEVHA